MNCDISTLLCHCTLSRRRSSSRSDPKLKDKNAKSLPAAQATSLAIPDTTRTNENIPFPRTGLVKCVLTWHRADRLCHSHQGFEVRGCKSRCKMKLKSGRFGSSLRCRVWRLGFHPWGSRSWQRLLLRLNAQETLRWKGGFIRGMIQALLNTIWHPNFEIGAWHSRGRRWLVQRLTFPDLDHCEHRACISCLALDMPTRSRARPGFVCVFRPRGAWKDDDPGAGSKCDLCRELC